MHHRLYRCGVAGHTFVERIIHNLVDHVVEAARWEINQALKANQPLALKLVAIRKVQHDKRQAEIAAEQAAYVPFFAPSAN
jgi:hypothetical protein